MKIFKVLFCVSILMALCLTANSAVVMKLNFDSATGTDFAEYTLGPKDTPTTATVTFPPTPEDAFPHAYHQPGARNYGVMGGVDTENYPDIVTPSTLGFQGGNAFYTCTGDVLDSQQHIGWFITQSNAPEVTGSFTAEAIVMTEKLSGIQDSEHSLQPFFGSHTIDAPRSESNTWSSDSINYPDQAANPGRGASWAFRIWPDGNIGGTGQISLNTKNTDGETPGENNIETGTTNLSPDQWYHVACVYNHSTSTIELFLDGVSQGTTDPHWGSNTSQDDWWIGAWPSNGANRGLAGWLDAVCISDEALTPSSFELPRAGYTKVSDWELY